MTSPRKSSASVLMSIVAGSAAFLCAGIVFGWTATLALGVVAVASYAVKRWRAKTRKPTRDMFAMDHDVQERIRAIAAESQYSSAGIEF